MNSKALKWETWTPSHSKQEQWPALRCPPSSKAVWVKRAWELSDKTISIYYHHRSAASLEIRPFTYMLFQGNCFSNIFVLSAITSSEEKGSISPRNFLLDPQDNTASWPRNVTWRQRHCITPKHYPFTRQQGSNPRRPQHDPWRLSPPPPTGATATSGPGPLHYQSFTIKQDTPHTIGRTFLDEWSARRRALYLTTHNTHK
jgi:hypothetical protein